MLLEFSKVLKMKFENEQFNWFEFNFKVHMQNWKGYGDSWRWIIFYYSRE